jgi:hypothetical protein
MGHLQDGFPRQAAGSLVLIFSSVACPFTRRGAKKTVLSTAVISHLVETTSPALNTVIAHFYFDSRDESPNPGLHCFASLLAQIIAKTSAVSEVIKQKYQTAKTCGRSRVSEPDCVQDILQEVCKGIPSLYIVIDALDECSDTVNFVKTVAILTQDPSLRVACLSRDVLHI